MNEHDDGTAFVGRLGAEWNPAPFYLRGEVSFVSAMYGGDAQAELEGIAGVDVADNWRMEAAGTYYTDWKEYFVTLGVSYEFR